MRISGYHVYRIYLTYKTHFNSKAYSLDKYNFHLLKPSYESFLDIKGQHYYDILAEKCKKEDFISNLFIAAFMDDATLWIGDIVNNYSHYIDLKTIWEGRLANLGYTFKQECLYLLEKGMKFDDKMGEFVFQEWLNAKLTLETFIILKKMFHFSFDSNIAYDYSFGSKYEKYECLLKIDKDKYRKLLEEAIMSNRD